MLTESKMKKIAPTSSYSTAPICYLLYFYFSLLPKFMNHKYRSIFSSYLRNFQDFLYRMTTYSSPVATCQRYSIKKVLSLSWFFWVLFRNCFPTIGDRFSKACPKGKNVSPFFPLLRKQLKGPLKVYFVFLFFFKFLSLKNGNIGVRISTLF